jgi:hypothetical protein
MVLPVVNVAEKNASPTRFALVHAFGHRALKVRKTCRSEHARDEPESAEGCQVPSGRLVVALAFDFLTPSRHEPVRQPVTIAIGASTNVDP